MDLGGRVPIVTGGGTGIGRATSLRLAKGRGQGGDRQLLPLGIRRRVRLVIDGGKNVLYQPLG